MDNDASIKLTADVTDFQSKLAAAQEAVSQLGDGLNTLAKQSGDAAKEASDVWKSAINRIGSAESSLIRDVLEKRKGLSRDMLQIAEKLAESEIADDAKMWTAKILNATVAQRKIAAIGKGGTLYRAAASLFGDSSSGTGAAVAQQVTGGAQNTAQTAAVSANTAALTALTTAVTSQGAVVAANSGATLSNTGATLTGGAAATTNTAVTAANTTAQSGNLIATIANTVSTDALTIAQWALTAIDAIGDIMPFASGADNIPNDMVAMVHKGEMIIPADHAATIRAAGGFGGWELKDVPRARSTELSGGDFRSVNNMNRGGDTNFHNHYYPTINMREPADIKRLLGTSGAEFADSIQRGYRAGSPARPSGRTL